MGAQRSRLRRKGRLFISAGTTDTKPNERLTLRSRSERISKSSRGSSGMGLATARLSVEDSGPVVPVARDSVGSGSLSAKKKSRDRRRLLRLGVGAGSCRDQGYSFVDSMELGAHERQYRQVSWKARVSTIVGMRP